MNVRKMSKDELELLSYADIAYELLKEDKKAKTTPVLFGEVCKLLEISDDAMLDMIGDFYTTLATDKRFLLLDSAEWDLKEFHAVKKIVDEEDEEDDEEESSEDEEVPTETEDEAVIGNEEEYDEDDDDLSDLAILTEEELEEE